MHAKQFLVAAVSGAALVLAQDEFPATTPPVSTLSTTQSGVLPYAPVSTGTFGLQTIEGALTYDGPVVDGFTSPGGNATIQSNLPTATYQAILPTTNFDNATGSIITGTVTGATNSNGTGIIFTISLSGLPNEAAYGPFVYHVHNMPVSADGNCTTTLGHLDPTDRGEYHPCEATQPETCQVGDLAGKHGNITTSGTFSTSYLELYLSTVPGSGYFFGDKSVVIHSSNATRLTCANFTLVSSAVSNGSGSASASGSGAASPTSSTAPFEGVAAKTVGGSAVAFVAAAVVGIFFL